MRSTTVTKSPTLSNLPFKAKMATHACIEHSVGTGNSVEIRSLLILGALLELVHPYRMHRQAL